MFLNIFYVPGTRLGSGKVAKNKIAWTPILKVFKI